MKEDGLGAGVVGRMEKMKEVVICDMWLQIK